MTETTVTVMIANKPYTVPLYYWVIFKHGRAIGIRANKGSADIAISKGVADSAMPATVYLPKG